MLLACCIIAQSSAAAPAAADPATIDRGRYLATAADCVGCHTARDGAAFAGGRALKTPFGTFYTPNITPDPHTGIGLWSDADFLAALKRGLSPRGEHYYPAFPYTSFAGLKDEDALAIKAYLFSLPPVAQPNRPHELSFPFSLRSGLLLWKWLYFSPAPFTAPAGASPEVARGAYLVQVLGHCGECHTPRNWLGATKKSMNLAGTTQGPEGQKVPNITPDKATGLGRWSDRDIARVLDNGLLPNFDAVGGAMGEVVRNSTSRLDPADRTAITRYLATIPAIANPRVPAIQPGF